MRARRDSPFANSEKLSVSAAKSITRVQRDSAQDAFAIEKCAVTTRKIA
jgi:hypothetical protein